jgi:hypothetical protein
MTKSKGAECLEKCHFVAENCEQKEDGTWDCPLDPKDCGKRCRRF